VRRFARSAGYGLGGLLLITCLGLGVLIWQIDRAGRVDAATPSDVIIVFGARVEGDGSPGPDLLSRVTHAVDIWRAGYASSIICTGGFKNERLSAAAVCRRLAIQQGVPAAQIFLGDGTTNTAEDAQAASRVMAEHGWRTAIVVSHPLHILRARWLLRRTGVIAVGSPTSTQVDRIPWPLRLWYTIREAGGIIATVLDEWGWLPTDWRIKLQNVSHGAP